MTRYHVQTMAQQRIEQHTQLLKQAIDTLTEKGCVVHIAQDAAEAAALISELCGQTNTVCTFAPELEEIQLQQIVPQAMQTDLEAVVAQTLKRSHYNPRRAPLDNMEQSQIAQALQQYLGQAVPPEQLLPALKQQIKAAADRADWGITGADGIAADTGTIILAEDQGNGRLVSNIPTRHLAVMGLEKLYPSNEAALESIHAAWSAGSRQSPPVYYSYITGPSRTGDIEGIIVCGMHGPLEVHVILLDNGRSQLLAQGKGKLLQCLECGQCTAALQQLLHDQQPIPAPLTCKSLALANLHTPYQLEHAQWDALHWQCPVAITVQDLKDALIR